MALGVARSAVGEEDRLITLILNNLGRTRFEQGRFAEAEALYLEALAMRRKLLGAKHPRTAEAAKNLVVLYEAWGRPEEAGRYRARFGSLPDAEASAHLPEAKDSVQ